MKMKIKSAVGSSPGCVRTNNEDNFYIDGIYAEGSKSFVINPIRNDSVTRHCFGVFDGMGGFEKGEYASRICAETLKLYDDANLYSNIKTYIDDANDRICKLNMIHSGSTVALAIIRDDIASLCNIGDSRIYLFRDNTLCQLSVDHTRGRTMVEAGFITKDELAKSKIRHELTQHMGISKEDFSLSPYIIADFKMYPDDILLICSDGLTDMVKDELIESIIRKNEDKSPADIVMALIEEALSNGGMDNITTLIIKVEG